MAFSTSRVLRIVSKYSQELRNPYEIDGKKMVYDPTRYGYQYSNKLVKEGLENGAKFLNRIPKYKDIHPEILDMVLYQRYAFFYVILFILFIKSRIADNWQDDNREFEYQRFKDRAFIGRYSYRQLDVEFNSNVDRSFNL